MLPPQTLSHSMFAMHSQMGSCNTKSMLAVIQSQQACLLMPLQEQHAAKPSVQVCLYCRQPCGTDMFSVEPMWCCSWCPAVCHMHCYQELHPHDTSDNQSSRQQSMDQSRQAADSTAADSTVTPQPAVKRHRSKSLDSRIANHGVQDSQR